MSTPTRLRNDAARPTLPDAVRLLLDGYGRRCGCTGQCERTHAGGRCDADELASLTVAPADLAIPIEQAAMLSPEELIVWCHRCRDLAHVAARRRRRAQLDDDLEDAQLGLWGGS
jgi:hypothetical protein